MENPYQPYPVVIEKITDENAARDIRTFRLKFCEEKDRARFRYRCGQFAEISVWGAGESPIGIASSPMDEDAIEFTVKRYPTGVVTPALHSCGEGEQIGVRGPYGNGFPMEDLEGQDVVIAGGGFAFTTLRSLANYILHEENRARFGKLTILAAARDPGELIYKEDLKRWEGRDDVTLVATVDKGDEEWTGRVGFAAPVLKEMGPSAKDAYAVVCGPPIMIKTCIAVLFELGFPPERIINSLEMRMKCGIGMCGRCNIGGKYVCKDGPVFTYKELLGMPREY